MGTQQNVSQIIEDHLKNHDIMIFSKSLCPYCRMAKELFANKKLTYGLLELNEINLGKQIQDELYSLTGQKSVPNIFIGGKHIGGFDTVSKLESLGELDQLISKVYRDDPSTTNSPKQVETSPVHSPSEKKLKNGVETNGASANNGSSGQSSNILEESGDVVDVKPIKIIPPHSYDYDLIVLGGGSGGLAASKQAAMFDKKVAVFDYVLPTPIGTKWGLGGTCVNVGCIPKKLMHQSSILGDIIKYHTRRSGLIFKKPPVGTSPDSKSTRSSSPIKVVCDWEKLVDSIQNYIRSLNFKYKTSLRIASVTYLNMYAKFISPNTIQGTDSKGKTKNYTAEKFVIATGLRPIYLNIPGAKEYCITSDDLFSLPNPPGKTLCVGASYIALECAGFLNGFGYSVTVMVRSILLRGFDIQMADMIGDFMSKEGVRFIYKAVPTRIEKIEDGDGSTNPLYKVFYMKDDGKTEDFETFNTILLAIGRETRTADLNLESMKIHLNPRNGKVITDKYECTNVPHIFAIGDNADGVPELTPVAIEAGRLLAQRLFDPQGFTTLCDYDLVPTTIFTPIEYGTCGLTEEEAITRYGKDNLEIYIRRFKPLDWAFSEKFFSDAQAMFKLIAVKSLNKKVVGFHILSPNAGEYMQGYAVAMKHGKAKLEDYTEIIESSIPLEIIEGYGYEEDEPNTSSPSDTVN